MNLKLPYSSSEELFKRFSIHSYVFLSKTLKMVSVAYQLMGVLCPVHIKALSTLCVSAFGDSRNGGFGWWTAQRYRWGIPAHISSNTILMFFLQQTAIWSLENIRTHFPKLSRFLFLTSSSNLSTVSLCTWLWTHQYRFGLLILDIVISLTLTILLSILRGCFKSPTL